MKRSFAIWAAAAACSVPAAVSPTYAETAPNRPEAAQLLADAADAGTYTFLLFYRDRGTGTQAMLRTIVEQVSSAVASAGWRWRRWRSWS